MLNGGRDQRQGFTIIELLIVIAIIGLLAGLTLNGFRNSQAEARRSKSETELRQIEKAVARLVIDVDKWPSGCIPGLQSNPEAFVEDAAAGLTTLPPIGSIDTDCEWTASDVSRWQGPYLSGDSIIDAWGNSYIFDPDYYPWRDCSSQTNLPTITAVVTYGDDGLQYTCDDIYLEIDFVS